MRALVLLVVGLAACSWSRFDDLSQRAPAREIGPAGVVFVGEGRPGNQPGLMMVAVANGASLTTADISEKGVATVSTLAVSGVRHIDGLAPGPPGPDAAKTPLVWTAAGNVLRLINPLSAQDPFAPPRPVPYDPSWGAGEPETLGLCLASAALGTPEHNARKVDLVAGAKDALLLLRMSDDGYSPVKGHALLGLDRVDQCSLATGAVGDPTAPTQVLAVGRPGTGEVLVVSTPSACVDGTCATVQVDAPPDADGFGTAVAIGDFDPAPGDELLVGAPGAGKVFVYSFQSAAFALVATLSAPAGAGGFGAALDLHASYGADHTALVVGAPAAPVDGVATSGVLAVYDRQGADPQTVSLASANHDRQLGSAVRLVPFQRSDEATPRWILAAAGLQSLYLFFADPVSGKNDVRVP